MTSTTTSSMRRGTLRACLLLVLSLPPIHSPNSRHFFGTFSGRPTTAMAEAEVVGAGVPVVVAAVAVVEAVGEAEVPPLPRSIGLRCWPP